MKKILFGMAVMLFGITFEQYLHEGWAYVMSSFIGLTFAVWGLCSKDEK